MPLENNMHIRKKFGCFTSLNYTLETIDSINSLRFQTIEADLELTSSPKVCQ